jgi:hypothetical protein
MPRVRAPLPQELPPRFAISPRECAAAPHLASAFAAGLRECGALPDYRRLAGPTGPVQDEISLISRVAADGFQGPIRHCLHESSWPIGSSPNIARRRTCVFMAGPHTGKDAHCVGSPDRSAGAMGSGVSAFQSSALVLGQPAPHPGVMAGLYGPAQTGPNDLTATADDLCLFGLENCGVAVPDREEQLGVLVQTGSAIAPCQEDCVPHPTEVLGFGVVSDSSGCAFFGVTVRLRSFVVQVSGSVRGEH